jgi:hypothetical protein
MKVWIALVSVAGVGLAAYAIFGALEGRAYTQAVTADAQRRGFDVGSIRYRAHWPLDFYATKLRGVESPEAAETIVSDADSVRYFVTPIAAAPADSLLVQAFYFRVGKRVNSLQLSFPSNGTPQVDGSDWPPDTVWLRPRQQALAWLHGARPTRSPTP